VETGDNWLKEVVGSTELESVTSCVSSRRSNQLSYEPTKGHVATGASQDNMRISADAVRRSIVIIELMNRLVYEKEKGCAVARPAQ
jgi:hypothetical protein